MWRSLALAVVALLAVLAPAAGLEPPRGPMAIVLHVNILNQTVSLNGSYSEQRVSLGGEVRVDYVITPVKVSISSSTDAYWASEVDPASMVFNSSGVQYFAADVTIPAITFNRTANLTVRGNATIQGLPIDTASDTAAIYVTGPVGGDGPDIPPVQPPGVPPSAAAIPNMPAIAAAVSATMVCTTAAVLWIWKARRLKKPEKARAKRPPAAD